MTLGWVEGTLTIFVIKFDLIWIRNRCCWTRGSRCHHCLTLPNPRQREDDKRFWLRVAVKWLVTWLCASNAWNTPLIAQTKSIPNKHYTRVFAYRNRCECQKNIPVSPMYALRRRMGTVQHARSRSIVPPALARLDTPHSAREHSCASELPEKHCGLD